MKNAQRGTTNVHVGQSTPMAGVEPYPVQLIVP
jgi:hypothetical protein